jgi:hypothetical protein
MFFVAGPLEYASHARTMGWEGAGDKRGAWGYGSFESVATLPHSQGRLRRGRPFSGGGLSLGSQIAGWASAPSPEPAFHAYWTPQGPPRRVAGAEIDDRLCAKGRPPMADA